MSETPTLKRCNNKCPYCCVEVDEINAKIIGAMRIMALMLSPIMFLAYFGAHVYFAVIGKDFSSPTGVDLMVWAFIAGPWSGESIGLIYQKWKDKGGN